MFIKHSVIAFVVASTLSFGASAADETKQDFVGINLSAEKYDLPTLSVGVGGSPLKVAFDFAQDKFITLQGLPLNVLMHNPSASFDSFKLSIASYSANSHQLTGRDNNEKVPYNFYLGTNIGPNNYKVAQTLSESDPFSGPGAAAVLDDATKLSTAGLGAFIPLLSSVAATEQNINTSTTLSLTSDEAPGTLKDDTYLDTAKLFVSGTWANYAP
ncbi:hypothetical protein [Aeromonas salmonicida]|uniref:hypothetical protein n=1 Tax=Aeromonas salmonicida TaxID=645 RepID=UPI003D1FE5AE